MSVWNTDPKTGITSIFNGLHTVALSVNADGSIEVYNLEEKGKPTHIASASEFEDQFGAGYSVGYKIEPKEEDE